MAPRPTAMNDGSPDSYTYFRAFWGAAVVAYLAGLGCLALWSTLSRERHRAAAAELRLTRTRKRLRTAEAELREADEYLASTGELLECYEEEFGPLPVNPFAPAPADAAGGDEWPDQLLETSRRED